MTLEIGGGSGNLDKQSRRVITSDIQRIPWLDTVADAQFLPFVDGAFDNIVMLDVLHHLANPNLFFREAERVVKSGGRVVMLEPAITPVSWLFFKLFHDEPVDISACPLDITDVDHAKNPYESNQAVSSLIFRKYRQEYQKKFPGLAVLSTRYLSPLRILYPAASNRGP